jgi:LacI family transcriptional regulator
MPSAREYDRGILRGILDYAHIHGPWIFYEEPPNYLHPPSRTQRINHMRKWKADGLITHQDLQKEIRALRLPTITMIATHRLSAGKYQVICDNRNIGRMAADHLLGLGLRQFAFCGLKGMEWSAERCAGFTQRIRESASPAHVYAHPGGRSGESWYTEEKHLGNWLKALPKPIGLMACNDDRARMVAEICRINSIRVPDEIAIIGVDNDEHVCRRATPSLSSVAISNERSGYELAAMLDRLMSGKKVPERLVVTKPAHVVTRQSTDLIASSDTHIVKALRYIRTNRNRVIHVSDVAESAGLSRRVLQDRFRSAMNRTVLEEICNVRIQAICSLLTETNLSIAEIAESVGYTAEAHIARFFSRRTGMTPLEYRRKYRQP